MNPFRMIASRTPEEPVAEPPAPFSGEAPTCVKCRHKNLAGPFDKYDPKSDTISRRCVGCSFVWVERAADFGSSDP